MLCSVYTTIAGEYDGPGFCTPIGYTYNKTFIDTLLEYIESINCD